MDDNLRVDPVHVRLAGEHVDGHAGNFLAGHAAAHERIAAAQGGFIGDSATALAELTAHWSEETSCHHRELSDHVEHLRTTAARYQTSDADVGVDIKAAADVARRMGM